MKVLVIAANPATSRRLQVDEEIRKVRCRLRRGKKPGVPIELRACRQASPAMLVDELLRFRPEIVHFIAHGTAFRGIVLEDEDGAEVPLDEASCGEIFRVFRESVRLVVLNACVSRPYAAAIARHVDCAIGMNMPIEDAAAVAFSATFYGAIGAGCSVQDAFDLACVVERSGARPELLPGPRAAPSDIILVRPKPQPQRLGLVLLALFVLSCVFLGASALHQP
ncbi:CHAT domain-containing protein [Sorangium sp. So ce134]